MRTIRRCPIVLVGLVVAILGTSGIAVATTPASAVFGTTPAFDAPSLVPAAKRPPSRPRTVRVTAGDRSARVRWKAPTRPGSHPITGYVVQRSIGNGPWTTVTVAAASQRAVTIGPLPTATSVRVRVAARSRGGTSRWSSVRSTVLPTVRQVTAGEGSTCALAPNRTVLCWGANAKGQLGIGNSGITRIPVPVQVPGLTDVREITSGLEHHCARRGDGTVWCWGDSVFGQLTVAGVVNHRMSPIQIPGLAKAAQVSAGMYHTCIRTTAGGVQCWGVNSSNQLGATPIDGVATVGITGVVEVRGGGAHTCARLSTGTVRCWGRNAEGQSGGSPSATPLAPTIVPGLTGTRGLALGEAHTCVLLSDATARCFGAGNGGQLGDGSTASSTSAPQTVIDAGPIAALAASRISTCAVYEDSTVRCWGSNFYGNFGTGTTSGSPVSVPVLSEFGPARSVIQGWSHGCGLRTDGHLLCAGRNHEGQLGNATTTNSATLVSPQGL